MINNNLSQSPLGKKTLYDGSYDPKKLFPVPRKANRDEIGVDSQQLPFFGFDLWNHYEVSWLNAKGKPIVALAEILYGCDSEYIIESKSMKLYFHSLNNTKFDTVESVQATIQKDLKEKINGSFIEVNIKPVQLFNEEMIYRNLPGICLDELDIACNDYHVNPDYLFTENEIVEETLYSDLLKSNCLITNQPDWSSIQIAYRGKKINHEGLLRYLVSFRNDNEFHEQCVEKIFMHIVKQCQPQALTVDSRATRRGGIGISSYRSMTPFELNLIAKKRLCRQ